MGHSITRPAASQNASAWPVHDTQVCREAGEHLITQRHPGMDCPTNTGAAVRVAESNCSCGRQLDCQWAGCGAPATVVLRMTRPCGHLCLTIRSCDPCARKNIDAHGGTAENPSSCQECGERAHVSGHREWHIGAGPAVR